MTKAKTREAVERHEEARITRIKGGEGMYWTGLAIAAASP
jgi:hypothetical protein